MHDLPATRRSLLLDLARNDEQAWEEFVGVYEHALLQFCQGRGLQPADASDVVQDVLAALARKLPEWDHQRTPGAFRAWVFRVARNLSMDLLAKRAREPHQANSWDGWSSAPETLATEFDLVFQRTVFARAAELVRDEVRPVTWQCFHETAVRDRRPEEVAQQLGISVGSVYTAKCRVLARLREHVAQLMPDPQNSTGNQQHEG